MHSLFVAPTGERVRQSMRGASEITEDLRVVAVAIQLYGIVHMLPPPFRHYHVMQYMTQIYRDTRIDGEQGFLLSDGRFARRAPAMLVARAAGQLIPRTDGYAKGEISSRRELYSEDVW